jgi:hypothetical protein
MREQKIPCGEMRSNGGPTISLRQLGRSELGALVDMEAASVEASLSARDLRREASNAARAIP